MKPLGILTVGPRRLSIALSTLLVFLEIPLKAYADPGSGLLLWQVAGAFFLGVVYQIRKFFSRNRKNK
jgi:type IV secretory pathway TrbD component